MTMTLFEAVITILMVILGTVTTRFLPFLLFPSSRPTPPFILYLGKVLPFSVIGLLVVYCLKNVSLLSYPFGLPEALGIFCTAALHLWKKNMLLSIAGGTVLYMLLVQMVFV